MIILLKSYLALKQLYHNRFKNQMDDDRDLKVRIDKAAKNYRLLKRADVFQRNRKNVREELSYLKVLSLEQKSPITLSINDQIPAVLPPLSPYTISYYRRSNKPIFRTKAFENAELNPHMTYESLFILAGIEEVHFPNYQQIVKEFETDLEKYLNSPYPEIRQMAMIAAGNKILGKEKDIEKIVELDPKQMWVMINHIYERKISSSHLFRYLKDNIEIVFRSLFEMSNSNDDEIIEAIMKNDEVIGVLIQSLHSFNVEIRRFSLRIIGNILAEKEEYVSTLEKYGILEFLYEFLKETDNQLRKDSCWALSNFAVERNPATSLLNHQNGKMIEKLAYMLLTETDNRIRVELCHIFSCLVAFAQRNQVFKVVEKGQLLERCEEFLQVDDQDLIHVTLYLISKIIELGDYFAGDDGNYFVEKIKNSELKNRILEKTYYTENSEISKLSSELEQKLEDY